jgi:hypothetical protein
MWRALLVSLVFAIVLGTCADAWARGGSHSSPRRTVHAQTYVRRSGGVALPRVRSAPNTTQRDSSPRRTVNVQTYVRNSGRVVLPHVRTAPNKTQRDNWSSKPNVNPTTGKRGTRVPQK